MAARKAKQAPKPEHPAILALRTAHAEAFPGVERGSCCASDLGHDEHAIRVSNDQRPAGAPFFWFMSPMATHMVWAPPGDTLTSKGTRDSMSYLRNVIDTYRGGPMLLAIWDGASLQTYPNESTILDAYERRCIQAKIRELMDARAVIVKMAAEDYPQREDYYREQLAKRDAEIAILRRNGAL